jgi:hypothetical protein
VSFACISGNRKRCEEEHMTTDKDKGIVGSATTMTSNAPPRSAARSLHAPN